jgi:hypothetical protein
MDQSDHLAPSEQKALNQLKRVNSKRVLDPLIAEFKNQNDRAAVIVGAAQLDDLLAELLAHFLLDGRKVPKNRDEDLLLGRGRPLSTFSSRITAAHRLGLIGDSFARSMNIIREMRNAFAHQVHQSSLDKSPHRDRISQLSDFMPSRTFWKLMIRKFGQDTPGNRFRAFVALSVAMLMGDISNVARATRQPLLGTNWNGARGGGSGAPGSVGMARK